MEVDSEEDAVADCSELKNQPLLALPASLGPGLVFCTKKILQTGIICVGAKLSVYDVASTGSACVPAARSRPENPPR